MSPKNDNADPHLRVIAIHCPRLNQKLSPEEHADCLYCHGARDDIRSAKHEVFCGFDPEKDPVSFGFPDEFGRQLRG